MLIMARQSALYGHAMRHRPTEGPKSTMHKPAITVMVKAARLAGNVLLRNINRLDSLTIVQKARLDYASDVDRDAEAVIIKELKRAYPQYAILGEESGFQGSGQTMWVIDPLDGTSNYLHSIPHYCISIARVVEGEPHDAVIFDPIRNELFTASKGAGALLNDRKIRVSPRKDLTGSLLLTGFAPRERERASRQLSCLNSLLTQAEDIRRTGSSALDLAYIACGRADAYFEAGVKAWDIAAGILLVREAGGSLCTYHGAPLPRVDQRGPETYQIVGGNVKILPLLQQLIAQSDYGQQFNATQTHQPPAK